MHADKPIQSQEEADKVLEYLVTTTANTLKIPKDEAIKRVNGLRKSGILNSGDPNDPKTQMLIEAFLNIPSSNYAHLG